MLPDLVREVGSTLLAAATQDAVALLWLSDQSKTEAVALHLLENKEAAGIDHLIQGAELTAMFGDPLQNTRIPDLVVVVQKGVIYTDGSKKVAEHGGFSEDDRKVALLVVGASPGGSVISEGVETRQLAPTILDALGLEPSALEALAIEPTTRLPGLTFGR